MGKKFVPVLLALVVVSCESCSRMAGSLADSVSSATARKGPPARVLLGEIMPAAMEDGVVKIAVLVNLRVGDISRLYIEGAISEGRYMGFTVDSFVSNADEARCREIAEGIAKADYDGFIFAYGGVDFSYDILMPIADRGIPVVTFEALPYRDGRFIKGLITTFRDDYSLARLSLETLLSYIPGPARVIRLGCDPGITFLDRRAWVFDEFVARGKIEEAALVKMDGLENPRSAAWEALVEILPRFPEGTVDALWVPWDEFAWGCAEALAAAGRHDIKMVSIGISNEDLHLMQLYPDVWLANIAVDPKLVGVVNMRILAAMLAGEDMEETFSFSPQLVKTSDLNHAVNMANITVMLPDWGDGHGLFDSYRWMIDLKATEGKYLRIPPVSESPAAP